MFYKMLAGKLIVYLFIGSLVFSSGLGGMMLDGHKLQSSKKAEMPVTNKKSHKAINTKPKQTSHNPKTADEPYKKSAKYSQANLSKNFTRNPKPSTHMISQNDLPMLARIIHAEAGGESLKGQVAVGSVLINRIKSGKFPCNLAANIFKPGEFESVSNGYIWSQPNDTSFKAARLALNGWDPTYGALYFFNPAKTRSNWIWNRLITVIIGKHNFAT